MEKLRKAECSVYLGSPDTCVAFSPAALETKEGAFCALEEGDVISLGGVEMTLLPINNHREFEEAQGKNKSGNAWYGALNLLVLTLIQIMACLAFLLGGDPESFLPIIQGFVGVALCQWLLFLFYVTIDRSSFEVETIAFFLCTMGMAAIATVNPPEMVKQLAALGIGIALFLGIGWALRDLERSKMFRYIGAVAGVLFLVITLLFGKEYYGAKNWLIIGGVSLQPSELSKFCFVFAGAVRDYL